MFDIAARNVGRVPCTARVLHCGGNSVRSVGRFGVVASAAALLLSACSAPSVRTELPAATAAATAPVPKHPALEVAQLASLTTLSSDALVAKLGRPDFTRHDPPAEIWQYRGTSCVLDVFLYPEDGEMKVLHAATRDRERVEAPENRCTPFGPTRSASAGS